MDTCHYSDYDRCDGCGSFTNDRKTALSERRLCGRCREVEEINHGVRKDTVAQRKERLGIKEKDYDRSYW